MAIGGFPQLSETWPRAKLVTCEGHICPPLNETRSAGPEAGYGNAILLDHGNGITTKYGHLSEIDIVVGQEVKRGQIIGAVGSTGRTTGPHLHYEVHIHDAPVNPATYLHG